MGHYCGELSDKEVNDALRDEIKRTVIHYGEGLINPATIACVIRELEKKLKMNQGLEGTASRGQSADPHL